MHPITDNIPTYSPDQYPHTVLCKHVKQLSSSERTEPTIETSPLTAEQCPPVTVHCDHEQSAKQHRYSNSNHDKHAVISTQKKNSRKESRRIERNRFRYSSSFEQNEHKYKDIKNDGRRDASKPKHGKNVSKSELSRHSKTLIWRMDPSVSLSDFTLTIVGINDKVAVENYFGAKRQRTLRRKRKDSWMVDGLYLDMSQSEEDGESSITCRSNPIDGKYHGCDEEHRSDVQARTTICGTKTCKYHLHKVNLAVGIRSCDYFARLFQKKKYSTSNNEESYSIELPLSCLPAIPTMLDYLYDPDPMPPLNATAATAIPLRYLGTLLGNRSLFESATRFLLEDLRPKTAIEYLQHAELYQQQKLAKVCIRICAESFDQLKITWFASLTPTLMKRILHSEHFTRSIDSKTLCSKIASYCRCQLHKIDTPILLSLTSTKIMPAVCQEEALFFINILIRLGMDTREDLKHDHFMLSKERNLYVRCINAAPVVVQGVIDSLSHGNNSGESHGYCKRPSRLTKNACGDYSRMPPHIKVDLLESAMMNKM